MTEENKTPDTQKGDGSTEALWIVGGLAFAALVFVLATGRTHPKWSSLVSCKADLKESLVDPSSFKVHNPVFEQLETGQIVFSGTNGYNARIRNTHDCPYF